MDSTRELINAAINCALDWLSIADSRQCVAAALCEACKLGNLRLVKLFAEGYRFTADEREVIQRALLEACRAGNLDIAIWLKDRYSLTVADALKALERCCNPRGVECLTEAFNLTAEDAREALKNAYESENIDVVWGLLSYIDSPRITTPSRRIDP